MRTLALALTMLLSTCSLAPAQTELPGLEWQNKPVLCASEEAVKIFYREQGLYPLIGGGSRAMNIITNVWEPVVYYVMINDTGGLAVMEYNEDGTVCSMAFAHGITFDTEELKGYIGLE